jgi:hypothetical protein
VLNNFAVITVASDDAFADSLYIADVLVQYITAAT